MQGGCFDGYLTIPDLCQRVREYGTNSLQSQLSFIYTWGYKHLFDTLFLLSNYKYAG